VKSEDTLRQRDYSPRRSAISPNICTHWPVTEPCHHWWLYQWWHGSPSLDSFKRHLKTHYFTSP